MDAPTGGCMQRPSVARPGEAAPELRGTWTGQAQNESLLRNRPSFSNLITCVAPTHCQWTIRPPKTLEYIRAYGVKTHALIAGPLEDDAAESYRVHDHLHYHLELDNTV